MRKTKCSIQLLFLLVFIFMIDGGIQTFAENYYVASNGTDDGPGTPDKPLGTIQKALELVQPGDKVLIKAGTYAGEITISKSGTLEKPIVLKAYGDGEVVVKGRFEQKRGFKLVEGCKYTYEIVEGGDVAGVLVNLDTTKAILDPLTQVGSINELEKNVNFLYYYDKDAGKLYLRYLGDNPDKEQSIYVLRDGSGFWISGSNIVVDGLTFSHFAGGGVGVGGKNVTVQGCKFYLCGGASGGVNGGSAVGIYGADNAKIKNCMMTRVANGILVLGSKNTEITHNTIYKTRGHGIMVSNSPNTTIKNNIIYAGGPSGAVLWIYKDSGDTLALDYNCYLDYNTAIFMYWGPTDTRFPTYWDYKAAVKTQDQHSLSDDPLFVSTQLYQEDLRLKPDSPCLGKADDGLNLGWNPQ